MSDKNGGPAFPCVYVKHAAGEVGNSAPIKEHGEGVSLRDYFAAKALPAILAVPEDGIQAWAPTATAGSALTAAEAWAKNAYEIADAMIAERAK